MKRTLLIALGCIAANISVAQAADVMDMPVYDWTGFYAGANAGYAFGGDDSVGMNPGFGHVGDLSVKGMFGGLQAGYNQQMNNLVLGVEGDINLSGISDKDGTVRITMSDDVNYFGTLRGRGGFAADKALFYVTGGLALGSFDYEVTVPGAHINDTFSRVGYTYGAGVEYAFDDAWSMKAEYLFAGFGKKALSNAGVTTFATPSFHLVRVGLNYRF